MGIYNMWEYLTTVTTLLLNKEEFMVFIAGIVLGIIIGGLIGTFVVPMFWKPKAQA